MITKYLGTFSLFRKECIIVIRGNQYNISHLVPENVWSMSKDDAKVKLEGIATDYIISMEHKHASNIEVKFY